MHDISVVSIWRANMAPIPNQLGSPEASTVTAFGRAAISFGMPASIGLGQA
jgi:hypothetical protein